MRLNSLLGLGGKAAEPSNKRQKRSDVLDSLGLGGPKVEKPRKAPGLAIPGAAVKPLAAVKPPEPVEPVEPVEGVASNGSNGSHGSAVEKAQAQAWRNAFSEADNQWSVSANRAISFYHDTEKDLFFEWDQEEGLLYQYFVQGEDLQEDKGKGGVERAPIWSAACPETHAEVWQVLPMPPTDPGAELASEEMAAAPASETIEAASHASLAGTEIAETSDMPPPPMKKKKLPPVPIMARSLPEDEDEDGDGDLKLPESKQLPGLIMGCEGPPASSSSSGVAPREPPEEEDDDPGGRSLVLEEGEEVEDLAAEECALPQAPEPVDFQATDLDLDIFG